MIVDDESKIRTGLSKFINWKSLDCEVIHVATNGDDALQKVAIQKPDIILTDIRMPKLNGIELAKHLYEHEPSIELILLTGYADFEYSKKAIQYDIVDFVLKPTSPDNIATAVTKAKNRIEKKRSLDTRINNLENELIKNNDKMIELTLHKIINHIPVDEAFINTYFNPSLFNENSKFCCLLINVDYKNTKEKVERYYLQNVKLYINEIFNNIPHYIIVENHNNICIFLLYKGSNDIHNLENTIVYCTELIDTVKMILDFELKIGVSLYHQGMDAISVAYEEAKKALRNTFYFGPEPIYIFSSSLEQAKVIQCINNIEENIMTILKLFNTSEHEKTVSIIHTTFDILKNEFIDMQTARSYSLLLYTYLIELNDIKNISKDAIEMINSNFTQLNQAKNINELKALILTIYENAAALKSSNYDNDLVNKVNDYIALNYSQNISLSSISKSLFVNSSYLSRLYKQITNQNLTVYITKYRIDKAIELLKTTNMKIYKIAQAVGIDDATYFSQLFKKYTKHNPSDYR